MARDRTISKGRLETLRAKFLASKDKVLTPKQVHETAGAAYWRGLVKDLKAEGMNIESVRKGRTVTGYKYTGTSATAAAKPAAAPKTAKKVKPATKVAAVKKPKTAKKAKAEATVVIDGKAEVTKAPVKKAASKPKKSLDVAKVVEEIEPVDGDEDPDVIAILKQAGL